MFELPVPILGDISAFTITTPDLEVSLTFYQQLGFRALFRADFPFPWIQITDDALLIMLRKDSTPYLSLTYYTRDLNGVVATLEEAGVDLATRPNPNDMVQRCLIKTPDGANVSLVTHVDGFSKPAGRTMLTTPMEEYNQPSAYTNQVCGMFGELAHPVSDFEASASFWEKLGFKELYKNEKPYTWGIFSDGLSIVGLHQTTEFSLPTMTFFASDMKERIEKLNAAGFADRMTDKGPNNAVLETPEKQHINLFSLGM